MISRYRKGWLLPSLMICSLIASCGTSGEQGKGANVLTNTKHVPTSVAVSIAQMKFNPDTVAIQHGDTVVFTNHDIVDHNATALPDSAWASPTLHTGDSWKVVPDKSTNYFCSIHVVMKGRIDVK